MPCLDAVESNYEQLIPEAADWWVRRFSQGDLRRVIAAEHTGLLERQEREALELRFKDKKPKPWFENLLSATPTLEMGVDIGDLSSVLLCSVPPNQASFLQRMGRAGRRDGNAMTTTLADGNSPHDLYFFAETEEMIAGEVAPPGVFLQAAEVLRRQLFAFCMDDWVSSLSNANALPEKTSQALDAVEQAKQDRFPYIFCDHVLKHEQRLFDSFMACWQGRGRCCPRPAVGLHAGPGRGRRPANPSDEDPGRTGGGAPHLQEAQGRTRQSQGQGPAEAAGRGDEERNRQAAARARQDAGAHQGNQRPRPAEHADRCRPDTQLRVPGVGHPAEVRAVAQTR
jgi:superfamily II DNA/RNA helicase